MDERFKADLLRSGLTLADAEAAGMYFVANAQELFPEFKSLPAMVLPYYHPTISDADGPIPMTFVRRGAATPFARVRYLRTPITPKGVKPQRYDQPRQSGVHAYFSTLMNWQKVFDDIKMPIFLTEGEKKAVAGTTYEFPVIGLGGVYNFRDKSQGNELLPILAAIPWGGRTTYIVYDSDYSTNPDIRIACDRLAAELSLKYGATVKLVVIPPGPPGDDGKPTKQGLDDYLLTYGPEAFKKLVKDAQDLRKLDAAVLAMNADVAFIEHDGVIYDFNTRAYLDKSTFLSGSDYSSRTITQAMPHNNKVKTLQVAAQWLTHPRHIVYRDTAFDPSTMERTLQREEGGRSLNLWEGLPETMPGDVQPFLDLNAYVYSLLPPQDRDLALKLLIWKWQNPDKLPKIAITLIGVGKQGSGKSLWARCAKECFGPYGKSIPSSSLVSQFNSWLEQNLCVVFDEAEAQYVSSRAGSSALKKYIADGQQELRDLYRKGRQITNRSLVILTSNDAEVGNHEEGDRRMFVVSSPAKHPEGPAFYDRVGKWLDKGGIMHLRYYLQTYDLKGWCPPPAAPMTAEKRMAAAEGRTTVQRIGMQMRENREGYILSMCDQMSAWADNNELGSPDRAAKARDVKQALLNWPIRPYYTPEELTVMLPEIASALGYGKQQMSTAGQLSRDLRSVQIPYLLNNDHPEGFVYLGYRQQFLVVSDFDEYGDKPMTQADFDRMAGQWPTYGQLRLKSGAARPLQIKRKQED